MRHTRLLLAALVIAGAAVSSVLVQSAPSRDFPHGVHVEAGLECAQCHGDIAQSENLREHYLPKVEACVDCHERADLERWGYASIEGDRPRFPDFSHKAHISETLTCEGCHGALWKPEMVEAETGHPAHGLCMTCHNGVDQEAECVDCHADLREGKRLSGSQAEMNIPKPMDHHPRFLHDHQFASRLDGNQCRECHTQDLFCAECHMGTNVEVLVHERNWLVTHALSARKNLMDCQSCHDLAEDCSECHAEHGLRPADHSLPNWRSGRHAMEARRDIALCASCHDRDYASCAACHRDTGRRGDQPGRNIHPSGYAGDAGYGEWHVNPASACFDCHSAGVRQAGQGFCGYCHGPVAED